MSADATLHGSPDGPERVEVIFASPNYTVVLTAQDGHVELPARDGKLLHGMTLVRDGNYKCECGAIYVAPQEIVRCRSNH